MQVTTTRPHTPSPTTTTRFHGCRSTSPNPPRAMTAEEERRRAVREASRQRSLTGWFSSQSHLLFYLRSERRGKNVTNGRGLGDTYRQIRCFSLVWISNHIGVHVVKPVSRYFMLNGTALNTVSFFINTATCKRRKRLPCSSCKQMSDATMQIHFEHK